MFKRQNNMTVMDFTGIYENEKFYKHKNIRWLDLHELQGVYGYCSQEARRTIEAKISNLSPEGIHFIDSGNFHYVSEFWIEKMKHDFILVVFDHHSDMVQPLFDDILSCGSWILNSLENNKLLNDYKMYNGKVIELIGEYNYVLRTIAYKREMKKLANKNRY